MFVREETTTWASDSHFVCKNIKMLSSANALIFCRYLEIHLNCHVAMLFLLFIYEIWYLAFISDSRSGLVPLLEAFAIFKLKPF